VFCKNNYQGEYSGSGSIPEKAGHKTQPEISLLSIKL